MKDSRKFPEMVDTKVAKAVVYNVTVASALSLSLHSCSALTKKANKSTQMIGEWYLRKPILLQIHQIALGLKQVVVNRLEAQLIYVLGFSNHVYGVQCHLAQSSKSTN
jgi:hypothetical protein